MDSPNHDRWHYLTMVGGFTQEMGRLVLKVTRENGVDLSTPLDWYIRADELGQLGWFLVSTDALPAYTRANTTDAFDVIRNEVAWVFRKRIELTESGEAPLFEV